MQSLSCHWQLTLLMSFFPFCCPFVAVVVHSVFVGSLNWGTSTIIALPLLIIKLICFKMTLIVQFLWVCHSITLSIWASGASLIPRSFGAGLVFFHPLYPSHSLEHYWYIITYAVSWKARLPSPLLEKGTHLQFCCNLRWSYNKWPLNRVAKSCNDYFVPVQFSSQQTELSLSNTQCETQSLVIEHGAGNIINLFCQHVWVVLGLRYSNLVTAFFSPLLIYLQKQYDNISLIYALHTCTFKKLPTLLWTDVHCA